MFLWAIIVRRCREIHPGQRILLARTMYGY